MKCIPKFKIFLRRMGNEHRDDLDFFYNHWLRNPRSYHSLWLHEEKERVAQDIKEQA